MTLEEQVLAAADQLALEGSGPQDLVAEAFAWLGAHAKADPMFETQTASALGRSGQDRALAGRALARSLYSSRNVTNTRSRARPTAKGLALRV